MKSLKQLMVILSLALCCGLFVFESEIKAQANDKTDLAAIKGRQKVYVFAQSDGAKDKIKQALKTAGNLVIVDKPEDAEFFISESEDFKTASETPPNLRYTLNRLESPDTPPSKSQQQAQNDSSNPAKLKQLTVRKTTVQVYFLKADGTKTIVWSKDASSKISSTPQTTKLLNNSTDAVPEISQSYKAKDDAEELAQSFVKKLKGIN